MLLKILGTVAILLFFVLYVLQGWSKSAPLDRRIGVAFMIVFGVAAAWGVRTLFALGH